MARLLNLTVAFSVCVMLGVLTMADAEAKRFGGGKSFGGKNSFSQPLKRSKADTAPAKPTPAQQANKDRRQQLAGRGGMMGMLGGLALGGLLGAMFFGGAFENINFFDILIFGLIAFMLFKLLAARQRRQQPATAYGQPDMDDEPFARREASAGAAFGGGTEVPAGFDRDDFLEGAKGAYHLLQQAWDEGELAEIRRFTNDRVFAEIQEQMQARQQSNRTDVLKLDAELLEVREADGMTEATVLFDAVLREVEGEGGGDVLPEQVREVWHFCRPTQSQQPTWFVDGIQQLAD